MEIEKTLRGLLLMVCIVGVVFFSLFLFSRDSAHPIQSTESTRSTISATSAPLSSLRDPSKEGTGSMPIRLKIPKINVDADIEYVGLTAGGSMDVPKGPADVAWFDLGPRPGENGSAVIAGHYGWKDGIPAAFDDLYLLGKGDKIYVEGTTSVNGIGTTTVFVVREIRLYGNKDDAASVFYSSDGKAHLNLITCQGVWDKSQKSYSNRLVVFADQE